jgi:hypothetical protein
MNTFFTLTNFTVPYINDLIGKEYIVLNKNSDIYNIALFNSKIVNIDIENYSICVSFLNYNNKKIIPAKNNNIIISSYTILSSSNAIGFITPIGYDDYIFKKYKNNKFNKIIGFLCSKGKHIIFNGNMCSFFSGTDALILKIDICKKSTETNVLKYDIVNNISIVEDKFDVIENDIINSDLYDKIFYKNDFLSLKFAFNIINDNMFSSTNFYFLNKTNDEDKHEIISEIELFKKQLLNINNSVQLNRFYQRFKKPILNKKICDWIINETEVYANKYGWKNDNYGGSIISYDIKLENLIGVHNYFLNYELINIMKFISSSYNIPKSANLNIKTLNITKYSNELASGVNTHTDGEVLTFIIGLNDNYNGGGTMFDDGLIEKLNAGEMIVHCGLFKHTGLPVTDGCRYIIVGFIDINI